MKKFSSVKKSSTFVRAYRFGKSVAADNVVVYVLKRKRYTEKSSELGLTATKKYGKAVERSRARRIMREAYRQLCGNVIPGYDIIVVARRRLAQAKTADVFADLSYALQKLGLIAKGE